MIQDEDVSPVKNEQNVRERRRGEEADNSLGGEARKEAGGSQSQRVDRGGSRDISDDRERSRGVSGSPSDAEVVQIRNSNNNRNEKGVDYAPKSPKARFNANVTAIKLMRVLNESRVILLKINQMKKRIHQQPKFKSTGKPKTEMYRQKEMNPLMLMPPTEKYNGKPITMHPSIIE